MLTKDEIIKEVRDRYHNPDVRITIEATAKGGEEVLMNEAELLHSELIVKWAVKLFADYEAVEIAAAAHDWDRAFPEIRVPFESSPEKYWDYKVAHAVNTARVFADKFEGRIPQDLLSDVCYLIKRHEIGGRKTDDGQLLDTRALSADFNLEEAADAIQMADSIAGFIAFLDKGQGIEARGDGYGLRKIRFYYGRAPRKARKIIDGLEITNPRLKTLFAQFKESITEGTEDGVVQADIEAAFQKYDQ